MRNGVLESLNGHAEIKRRKGKGKRGWSSGCRPNGSADTAITSSEAGVLGWELTPIFQP